MTRQESLTEAISWRMRIREERFQDWEAFTTWLAVNPDHSAAYDQVALADAEIVPETIPAGRAEPSGGSIGRPQPHRWFRWAALAAVAAIVLFGWLAVPLITSGASRYEIATRPGERRHIALQDGSSIDLNGATRLILDRNDDRHVELAEGEAAFLIRHDAARRFVVAAGDHRVQDVGTAFNIVRSGGRFSVEVIEGAAEYERGGAPVILTSGHMLIASDRDMQPRVSRKHVSAMAGWRRGQLSYANVPLAEVASDLSRSIANPVIFDPAVANRPFTGSIRVEANEEATVTNLALALNFEVRRTGEGWIVGPQQRARD